MVKTGRLVTTPRNGAHHAHGPSDIMASSLLATLLAAYVATPAWALQVTPNSACASLCMDNAAADPSDPGASNTYGSDIVCNDYDYGSAVGLKYQSCMNCLQNSSAETNTESDQAWFLYNLRFALNTCLFGASNATDQYSTPCALSSVCDPLQAPLEDSMTSPSLTGEFSYCTAANGTFTSNFLSSCQQCLREDGKSTYLSNFLVALDGGCIQKPTNGAALGLNSTLFTTSPILITSTLTTTLAALAAPKKGLTRGAIAGIITGGIVFLLITISTIFVCVKKRRNARRLSAMRSPLDPRFGSAHISAPFNGAYSSQMGPPVAGSMYKSPPTSPPIRSESLKMMRAPVMRNFSLHRSKEESPEEWRPDTPEPAADASRMHSPPPEYNPRDVLRESLPAHVAYIPPGYTPAVRSSTSAGYTPEIRASRTTPTTSPRYTPQSSPQGPLTGYSRTSTSPGYMPEIRASRTTPTTSPRYTPPSLSPQGPISHPSHSTTPSPPSRTITPAPIVPHHPTLGANPLPARSRPDTLRMDIRKIVTAEEARQARQRLYREGFFGTTMAHGVESDPAHRDKSPDPASAGSSVTQEMWPGSY